jgi:hypothetical protein
MSCHLTGHGEVLSTVGNGLCNVERRPNFSAVIAFSRPKQTPKRNARQEGGVLFSVWGATLNLAGFQKLYSTWRPFKVLLFMCNMTKVVVVAVRTFVNCQTIFPTAAANHFSSGVRRIFKLTQTLGFFVSGVCHAFP